MKIFVFILTSVIFTFILTQVANRYIPSTEFITLRYMLVGLLIGAPFFAFWLWLFRTPRR